MKLGEYIYDAFLSLCLSSSLSHYSSPRASHTNFFSLRFFVSCSLPKALGWYFAQLRTKLFLPPSKYRPSRPLDGKVAWEEQWDYGRRYEPSKFSSLLT